MLKLIIDAIVQFFTWIVVVTPWEQALRVRLGKRVRLLEAGIYFKIPFVDRVYRQSVRRRMCLISPQTLSTPDGATLTISAYVGYRIENIKTLYFSLHDAGATIEADIASLVSKYITSNSLVDCTPENISTFVLKENTLSVYGLVEVEISINDLIISPKEVRTLRLVMGAPKYYADCDNLSTSRPIGSEPYNA